MEVVITLVRHHPLGARRWYPRVIFIVFPDIFLLRPASGKSSGRLLWFGGSEEAESDLAGQAPSGSSMLSAHSHPAPSPFLATA
jgi:hypothetical protein